MKQQKLFPTKQEHSKEYRIAYLAYWTGNSPYRPQWDDYEIGCYKAATIRLDVQVHHKDGRNELANSLVR
jgi:hypothetical protein